MYKIEQDIHKYLLHLIKVIKRETECTNTKLIVRFEK